jgi:hypothetical protein
VSTIKAAHCTTCGARTWRGLIRPDTQEWVPLFPDPASVYAVLQTPQGPAVGVGYCAAHAPVEGEPGPTDVSADGVPLGPTTVIGIQAAPDRYTHWFSTKYGAWLRTWTRELSVEFKTDEAAWAPLLAQWEEDRRVHA